MLFMGALGGAIVGYWAYNFNPASIFMGDTGSMFLGYVLGVGAMRTSQKSSTAVAILVPIVALGLPIADTLLAMLRRALAGRPMFSADREHIHHRLLDLGLTQRRAVIALYGVAALLGAMAVLLTLSDSVESVLILVAMCLLGYLAFRKLRHATVSRDSGAEPAVDGQAACAGLAEAPDERHLRQGLRFAARHFGICQLRLVLEVQEDGDTITLSTQPNGQDDVPWHFLEVASGPMLARMEYRRRQGELDARAVESVRRALTAACVRVYGPDPRKPD
jgi:hypothetical protein